MNQTVVLRYVPHTKYIRGEGAGLEDFGGGGVVAGVGDGGEEEHGP